MLFLVIYTHPFEGWVMVILMAVVMLMRVPQNHIPMLTALPRDL